jgi:uncharacterized phage protein (TIGR01671 family)
MREVKFRAYEKNLKEMIPVHDIDFEKKMINTESAWRLFDEVDLMQYTGLKDNNGKGIYEGDIIVYEIYNGVGIESYYARVFWSENEEKYKNRFEWLIAYLETDGFDALSRPAAYNEELEVIGNIYENPELLES